MDEVGSAIDAPYPWGPDTVVTGLAGLDRERKMWFVDQILQHGNGAASLARRFNLPRFAILHWVKAFRKRGILMSRAGRPRIVDSQGMEDIYSHCLSHGYADTPALRQQIRVSHHSTLMKRGRGVDYVSDEEEPPSKRSLMRYLAMLKGANLAAVQQFSIPVAT
jgi:transposase